MTDTSINVLLENLIQQTGAFGRFQLILVLITSAGKLPLAWSMLMMSFGGAVPDWWCIDDSIGQNVTSVSDVISQLNGTGSKSCSVGNTSQTCARHVYKDDMATLVSEVRRTHLTPAHYHIPACITPHSSALSYPSMHLTNMAAILPTRCTSS
jgi:hypothetical protein